MTDEQIEKLVMDEIRQRDITYYDMIHLSNQNIDPNPDNKSEPANMRARRNRFKALMGSSRMEELLGMGEYNPYRSLPPLKVSLQDLFRFWWNRCVEQELVVEEIFEDMFSYFTGLMEPPGKPEKKMDMAIDFEQLPLFFTDLDQAA